MNRRIFSQVALTLVLVLAVAVMPALAKTTVTFWALTEGNPVAAANQQKMFDAFEAAYPDIEVVIERIPLASFDQKCLAALAAGSGPDVLLVNSVSLPMFIERGFLQPTQDLLDNSTMLGQEDFVPSLWSHVAYGGTSFGLPLDTGTRALVYHKELLSETGMEFGDVTSWDDFKAAATKMTKDSDGDGIVDRFGYAYGTGEKWVAMYENYGLFAIQSGGSFLNEDLTKANVTSDEIKEATSFFVSLERDGLTPGESVTLTDQQIYQNMFAQGLVGSFIGGHWAVDYLETRTPVPPYGVTLLKNKQIGSSTGGWILAMSRFAKDRDAAWKFMEFVFQPDNLVNFTNLMPATIEAAKQTLQDPKYRLYHEVLPYSRHPIELNPYLPEIAEIMKDKVQLMLLGRVSVEQGLEEANREINMLLSR